MKIAIDREKCRGHSNCASIAPNAFELDANFQSVIIDTRGDSDELILKAAKACPKPAIVLKNDSSGERIFPGPHDKPGLFTHDSARKASPPERGNGPVAWSSLQTEFLERAPENTASARPSTKHGIEPFRLCASLFQARISIDTVSRFSFDRE